MKSAHVEDMLVELPIIPDAEIQSVHAPRPALQFEPPPETPPVHHAAEFGRTPALNKLRERDPAARALHEVATTLEDGDPLTGDADGQRLIFAILSVGEYVNNAIVRASEHVGG